MTATRVKRARRLLAAAVGVALVVIALALVSQTAGFRRWLGAYIETRLNAALAAHVRLGGLEGNLFSTFTVRDLRIALDGTRVLAIRHAVVQYRPLALLLGRRLIVTAAAVDGVALRLIEDERGWNVARLALPRAPDAPEAPGLQMEFAGVELRDAALTIIRPGAVSKFRQLALTGSVELRQDGIDVHLTSATGRLPGRELHVESLAGHLVVRDSGVTVEDLTLRTTASQLRGRLSLPHDAAQEYEATITVAPLSAAEMRRLVPAWPPVVDLSGSVTARGPVTAVAVEAKLTSAAGEAALTGTVDLRRAPVGYDLRADVTHLDTAALLGPRRPASDLSGTASARGSGTTFEEAAGTFALTLHDSTLAGTTLQALTASGTLAERRLDFEVSGERAGGRARARGMVAVPEERYELDATLADLDLASFVRGPHAATRLTGSLTVRGTGFTPATTRGELHLALAPSRVEAIDVRSAQADLRAVTGMLTVERLTVRSPVAAVDASGTFALASHASQGGAASAGATLKDALSDTRGTLRYEIRSDDVSAIAALVGAGPVAGRMTIKGTATGGIGALDLQAHGEAYSLRRDRLAADTLAIELRGRRLGTSDARVDATTHATGVRVGERHAEGLDAEASWQRGAGDTARGTLALELREDDTHRHGASLEAAFRSRETEILVRALRADLGGDTWTATGTPTIVRRGDRIAVTGFALRSQAGTATLEGSAGTSGLQEMTLAIDGLALDVVAPSFGEHASGRLSLVAHLRGTAANPEVDATVDVAAPTVGTTRYQAMHATLRAARGNAVVSARVIQDESRQLSLDAGFPLEMTLVPLRLRAGSALTGTIKAEAIDLAFLGPALPEVAHLGGRLDADLTVAGALATPDVRGALVISGGRAHVIPLGLTYEPIELRANVDGRTLRLERLRVVSGRGSLEGSGTAVLTSDGTTLDLGLTLARLPLFAGEYGEGAASGTIALQGSAQAPVVAGRLTTDRLVLKIPESLPSSVRPPDPTITLAGPGAPALPEEPPVGTSGAPPAHAHVAPTLYEAASIDLAVNVPRDAWIRRSDANIELRGALAGRKRPGEDFRMTGEIDAVRGWYSFQGKKLTLAEGRVTFTGESFDPLLHLIATHDADVYTVRVVVGGTITKPTLTLESDPPLEQGDVLAVLLFGRPAGRLSQAESAGLREQAISVGASYAASELRQSVADALGVDNLEFDTGTGAQGRAESKVSMGKYVARDVFISLAHRFGKQNVEELRVEYRFTPQWSVETSSDTLGESGVDVLWKKRY